MYSIGQFSIMFQVNKKTLRYYDEIGLFKPAHVDEKNQYRYYAEEQVKDMKEILRLRDVGIPLEQMKEIRNNQDSMLLSQCYEKRLTEIVQEQKELEHQKQLILQYKNEKTASRNTKALFSVERGYFLEEGQVYFQKVHYQLDQIHNEIGRFYENAKGKTLLGSHIFKMSLEEESEGVEEIFAYTSGADEDDVRSQPKQLCIKVTCHDIHEKTDGYQALFDYANEHECEVRDVYEKYHLSMGKMQVEILAAI